MDMDRIDKLIQYALLCAGEEDDFFDRKLGPIHLLKYVYLADVHYSAKYDSSFTGASWRFHNFGPWCSTVHDRIEAALVAIRAQREEYPSDYSDGDFVRWSARDEHKLEGLERDLPAVITLRLRREVHRFGSSTPELLDYVYKSRPMLRAAPREILDFSVPAEIDTHGEAGVSNHAEPSKKKLKKLKSGIEELRKKYHAKKDSRPKLVKPEKQPRYDEVFQEGAVALDNEAGRRLPESLVTLQFAEEIWKSGVRDPNDFA